MFASWIRMAQPSRNNDPDAAPADLGLVSGIVDGYVTYGAIARPLTEQRDLGGEPVVKSFRFAQIRSARLRGAAADRILICADTREEVRRFLTSAQVNTHTRVSRQLWGVTFRRLNRRKPLKGVDDLTCLQAVWS